MKELSIEEKAKRYDEAIERAKMSYNTGDYDKDTLEMLEIIFPELKENKDIMETKFKTVTTIEVPIELADNNVETFATIVKEMTELYAKKNHDYGNAFGEIIKEVGLPYGVGKLKEKLKRIETLINAKAEVNESIEDTLTDLACYSVMTFSYLRRNKNK